MSLKRSVATGGFPVERVCMDEYSASGGPTPILLVRGRMLGECCAADNDAASGLGSETMYVEVVQYSRLIQAL